MYADDLALTEESFKQEVEEVFESQRGTVKLKVLKVNMEKNKVDGNWNGVQTHDEVWKKTMWLLS